MTANEIREIRKEKGWTQAEMADFLKIRRATISDWETGKKGPIPSLAFLLERLKKIQQMQIPPVLHSGGKMCWYQRTGLTWRVYIIECGSVWEDDDPGVLVAKVRHDLETYNPDLLGNSEVLDVLNALIMEGD